MVIFESHASGDDIRNEDPWQRWFEQKRQRRGHPLDNMVLKYLRFPRLMDEAMTGSGLFSDSRPRRSRYPDSLPMVSMMFFI
jgi:hypothetical protein